MTPAPTTAALNTNMAATLAELGLALVREAGERAGQRVADRAADEQAVDDRRQQASLLELVVQPERDPDAVGRRLEAHALRAVEPAVLDRERLAGARLVLEHLLGDPAAAAGPGVPDEARAGVRPVALEAGHVAEPVDPRGPAVAVVPQRLGLRGRAGDDDRGLGPQSASARMASIERAMRSSRGPSSPASRARSASPASVMR